MNIYWTACCVKVRVYTCIYVIRIVNWKLSLEALSQPITCMNSMNKGNLAKVTVGSAQGTP